MADSSLPAAFPAASVLPAAPGARPRRRWWSGLATALLVLVLAGMAASTADANLKVSRWDVFGYYLYLPATTVYHDLEELKFIPPLLDRLDLTNRGNAANPLGNYEVSRAQTSPDRYVIKYTMGQALLWWPFFQAAHYYASHSGAYPADGYSAPYQLALYLAGLSYALLGLGLLRRVLLRYFSDRLSAVLLLVIYLGTNYLTYSVFRSLYAHNSLFMLHAATLLLTSKWLERQRGAYLLGLGLTTGLAVLIRPSEIIILLVPLLLGVARPADLRARFGLLLAHWPQVALAAVVAAAVNLPQLLYWHRMSDHWFYDSYPGEKFDFLHPKLLSGLFSFNNGWLTYTPLMALAVAGIGVLWFRRREWFWLLATYLPLHLLISYSWWCWWYMDSVGSRTMVQAYPVLALPLGMALHALWQQKWRARAVAVLAVVGCIAVNVLQTWQVRQGLFVTENMNSRYYGAIFGKTRLSKADLAKYDANEETPDAPDLQAEQVFYNSFGQDTARAVALGAAYGGWQPPACLVDARHPYSPGYKTTLGQLNLKPGDFVQGRIQAFFPQKEYNIGTMPRLIVQFQHPGQPGSYKWRGLRITPQVGEASTIWGGTPGVWDDVRFASKVPHNAVPEDEVSVYVNSSSGTALYIDDFTVSVLRRPR